ncbi:MAG: hypothetical protein RR280_04450 [Bacteroidaceae bacterium]
MSTKDEKEVRAIKKVRIEFETINSSFDPDEYSNRNNAEIADVLEKLAKKIRSGEYCSVTSLSNVSTRIKDSNGNDIGAASLVLRSKKNAFN